ncbi:hypothetical protein LMH87_005575 [Akanthomyces muscarius]|uniref:SGNH hydrolase-type esterase domain-containing protein n=1 Tax=Akanthomyces muscarius TaxID=2231603 RepID=A0A9W8UQQ1_AKAMU|nr:hypothetical protein LMH87_005575 [Akanthomyces muscarius]KAJ4163871.1 hypothetical protein LMH87_005575 [Akanthomyces muscarius]
MISSRPSGEALVARRAASDSASLTKRLMGWPIMQLMTWRLFAQFGTEKEAKERPDASANNTTVPMLLKFRNDTAPPHGAVGNGAELRILPLGDSITVGWLSDTDGGDGDGYRRQLQQNLSRNNKVAYAGTVRSGSLKDGYYAAWSGQTIQFIAEHAGAALAQRPNVVLLMAGTNDMNPDPRVSRQGHDPAQAAARLGTLIDMIVGACPDAVLLVAVIPGTCNADQAPQTEVLQGLIPGVAARRREAGGKQVLAVDFGGDSFGVDLLRDCIHPTNAGYRIMGDYWSDFIQQVPAGWIREPVGADPVRSEGSGARRAALGMLAWALLFLCI